MRISMVLYILCGLALVRVIADLDKAKGHNEFWGLMGMKYFFFGLVWPAILVSLLTTASLVILDPNEEIPF